MSTGSRHVRLDGAGVGSLKTPYCARCAAWPAGSSSSAVSATPAATKGRNAAVSSQLGRRTDAFSNLRSGARVSASDATLA
eukprot:146039-Prymnesium_polylepis.1